VRKVYKYEVKNVMDLPIGTEILKVDFQYGKLMIWCSVNVVKGLKEYRKFQSVMTGGVIPDNSVYIGTALDDNKTYIEHLYEIVF